MKNTDVGAADIPEALASAMANYRALTKALEFAISDLQSGQPADRDLMATMRQHSAALHKVLDIEDDLEKRAETIRRPIGAVALDLDDARREIYRRLDLLFAARGAGGVPEQSDP